MQRDRTVRSAACILAVALAVTACSDADPSGSPSTSAAQSSAPQSSATSASGSSESGSASASATATAAEVPIKGEITMWTFKQSHVKALEAAGAAWAKRSGYTVKVTAYTPDDAYVTKVRSAAQTKDLPDIVSVHSAGNEWRFGQDGIVQDITDAFDKEWQDGFLPGVVKATTLTADQIKNAGSDSTTTLKDLKPDHFYGVPYLAGTPGVVFTRKSTMEAAGLDPAKPPATWQDWVAAMQATKAKDPDKGGLVTGLQVPQTGYFWLYRPMSFAYLGKDAFYGRQGRTQTPAWNSPESVKTLEMYDQLTPLWTPGVLSLGIDQADQSFAKGDSAWLVGGTFTLSSLTTFGSAIDDIVVFPVPAATGGAQEKISYQASPLVSGSVSATSKHTAESIDFLKFLTTKEGATLFAETASEVSATALDSAAVASPLLKQLLGLMATESTDETFSPNDFSADPGGGVAPITSDTATVLNNLPAKEKNPQQVADDLTRQYKQAWAAQK